MTEMIRSSIPNVVITNVHKRWVLTHELLLCRNSSINPILWGSLIVHAARNSSLNWRMLKYRTAIELYWRSRTPSNSLPFPTRCLTWSTVLKPLKIFTDFSRGYIQLAQKRGCLISTRKSKASNRLSITLIKFGSVVSLNFRCFKVFHLYFSINRITWLAEAYLWKSASAFFSPSDKSGTALPRLGACRARLICAGLRVYHEPRTSVRDARSKWRFLPQQYHARVVLIEIKIFYLC